MATTTRRRSFMIATFVLCVISAISFVLFNELVDYLSRRVDQKAEKIQEYVASMLPADKIETITSHGKQIQALESFTAELKDLATTVRIQQQELSRLQAMLTQLTTSNAKCTLLEFTQGTYDSSKNAYVSKCPIPPSTKSLPECFAKRKLMVIGDSNAYHLFNSFLYDSGVSLIPNPSTHAGSAFQNCRRIKVGSKCGEAQSYFEFEPSDTLQSTCKNCNGCVSSYLECKDGSRLEYLSIEFIDDQQMPSKRFNTTQENIIEYMTRDPPDVILLNAGVHIMQQSHIAKEKERGYRQRLIWYLQEIRKQMPNTRLVWMQSPKMYWNEWGNEFQTWLYDINHRVARQNAVPVLDQFNFSAQLFHLRSDDVHYQGGANEFYSTVRNFLLTWYCSSYPPPLI